MFCCRWIQDTLDKDGGWWWIVAALHFWFEEETVSQCPLGLISRRSAQRRAKIIVSKQKQD